MSGVRDRGEGLDANGTHTVTRLPDALFDKLEAAAVGKKPQRTLNPSKSWGLPFDLFE